MREGESLASIAAALYGDASLWYQIADINGLSANATLSEGQILVLPAGVLKQTHNSKTFTAYDANAAIGDTSPTTPRPAQDRKNCGGFGQVLLAVIAIVVVVWTAGAAAAALMPAGTSIGAGIAAVAGGTTTLGAGTLAGIGAASAAAGSIVSQAVGVATGIQDKFSWNAVAMAAIGGGVGGAFGKLIPGTGPVASVGRAVAGSVVGQGIGVATGMQEKFSWAGVAAAGVGAAVGFKVGQALHLNDYAQGSSQYIARSTLTGMASGIADAAARTLVEGSDFGDNLLAALPNVIGQTIGEMVAGGISSRSAGMSEKYASGAVQKQKVMDAHAVEKAGYLAAQQIAAQADGSLEALDHDDLLVLTGGGTRPPPRGGIGHNSGGVRLGPDGRPIRESEPLPNRLADPQDWANMSDEEFYASLGANMRQRQYQDRIDGLQDAIRSLDPSYAFNPLTTVRDGPRAYESHLRDELGRVRMRVTLGNQEIDVNGYQYRFDAAGRMASLEGGLTLNRQNTRNQPAQLRAGGLDRLLGDQGGHYIGRQFNGPTREFNHFAQDGNFNMGAYRSLEGQWAQALGQGSVVNVRIAPTYSGSSLRPAFITVSYQINNQPFVTRRFTNQPGG